jgi:peptide chain release factor 3
MRRESDLRFIWGKIGGAAGGLQFDLINYQLENEYGAACWKTSHDPKKMKEFIGFKSSSNAYETENNPVYLTELEWNLNRMIEENQDIRFHFGSEFKTEREPALV